MSNIFANKNKENQIFLNESYLYPEFVPEKLPHRESEIDSLVYAFNPLAEGKKPINVFICGVTGTGKTACSKWVLKELEEYTDRVKTLYVNCFEYDSRHAILTKLCAFLGAPVPRRGIGTDETYTTLVNTLKNIDFTPVVILDEIDQLLDKDGSKLLYDLLRIVDHGKSRVGLVLISNDIALMGKLDPRVKSSLNEETILFDQYTPTQLKDILKQRCEYAFKANAIDKEVINVAAAHAAKNGGDARIAIESLLKAGRIAERKNVSMLTLDHLQEAFKSIHSLPVGKLVKNLSETEKKLLKIIAEKELITSGEIYEQYNKDNENALSERRIRDLINNLEKMNLIRANLVDLGNKGKTKKISLSVSKESLLSELN